MMNVWQGVPMRPPVPGGRKGRVTLDREVAEGAAPVRPFSCGVCPLPSPPGVLKSGLRRSVCFFRQKHVGFIKVSSLRLLR